MTKNVSLSFVVCFPRKRSLTERKSPLLGAQTVSLPFSARLLETTTHTTPSRTPLSLSHFLSLRKSSSFSSSFREREKETYFFWSFGCSLWADLFPVHFLPFQKSCIRSCTRCSLTLSRTRTQIARNRWDDGMLPLSFLRIHRSESLFSCKERGGKAFVLIFVWKHPNWWSSKERRRNCRSRETNETKREQFVSEERKAFARERGKIAKNSPRGKNAPMMKRVHHTPQLKKNA